MQNLKGAWTGQALERRPNSPTLIQILTDVQQKSKFWSEAKSRYFF